MVLESDHAESVLTVISVHRLFGCWFKCYIVVLESGHTESVLTVISVHRLVFDSSFTLK